MGQEGGTEIRVDSRLVYGLLAVVALVAVLAIGLVIGRGAEGTSATAAVGADPNATPMFGVDDIRSGMEQVGTPGGPMPMVTLNVPTTVDGQPMIKPVIKGKPPVQPDEAPIGPSEPRIWFTELASQDWELRLGDVSPTGPVERDVVIENIGTSPLTLVDAGGSCGCTAVNIETQELTPGMQTTVRIKYDPRVSNDAGKEIRKQIFVRSNDPLAPVAEFYIVANVLAQ